MSLTSIIDLQMQDSHPLDAWTGQLKRTAERVAWDSKYGLRDAVESDLDWRVPVNGRQAVDGDI